MSTPTVLYERDGRIARVTLNRPEPLNAIDTGDLIDGRETARLRGGRLQGGRPRARQRPAAGWPVTRRSPIPWNVC
jgi:hypothetical protein